MTPDRTLVSGELVSSPGVLGKVMLVLRAFGAADVDGVSFTEMQRRTGLAKGTLHRVLADMVEERLLSRVDGRFHLGRQLFELGMLASLERRLLDVAIPFLEDLYERTHETVHLGVLEGLEVVYVTKIGGHRQVTGPSRIGGRMPWHATAIGKALVAWAEPEVREAALSQRLRRVTPRTVTVRGLLARQLEDALASGVTTEHEESRIGVACIAAPVTEATGAAVAAVSITGATSRFRPDAYAAPLRAATTGIASTLARRAHLRDTTS